MAGSFLTYNSSSTQTKCWAPLNLLLRQIKSNERAIKTEINHNNHFKTKTNLNKRVPNKSSENPRAKNEIELGYITCRRITCVVGRQETALACFPRRPPAGPTARARSYMEQESLQLLDGLQRRAVVIEVVWKGPGQCARSTARSAGMESRSKGEGLAWSPIVGQDFWSTRDATGTARRVVALQGGPVQPR